MTTSSSSTEDEDEREFVRSLGVRSYIVVALRSRGRRIGVLTLIQAWSGRRHDEDDASFSQVLADRIALTLDNAGLFSDLESVEMRMDSVMDVLDEPVTITERDGKLIFANQAAIELADRDNLEELLDPEPGEPDFDIYDEDGEVLGHGVLPWQLPDLKRGAIVRMVHAGHGEETWLRVRSRMIPSLDNRPIYSVTAFEDVTEMKFAEFAQSVFASTAELLSTSTEPAADAAATRPAADPAARRLLRRADAATLTERSRSPRSPTSTKPARSCCGGRSATTR